MNLMLKKFSIFAIYNFDIAYNVARLLKPEIGKYKISTLYEYAKKNNSIVKILNPNTFFNYHMASDNRKNYEDWPYQTIEQRACSPQYVCIINNACVKGEMDAVIADNLFLTDKIMYDRDGFQQHAASRTFIKGDYCLVIPKKRTKRIKCGVLLVKLWAYNYFHLVAEGLSRLGEVDKLDEYKEWPLIIDSCVKDDPRNIEIINLLNVNHRDIFWIDKDEEVHVDELLIPATLSWGVYDTKKSISHGWGYMIDRKAGNYLRETVLSRIKLSEKKYNCVYVARGNNKRLVNESEIITYFKNNGFDIFYPEDGKTFINEVECFSTANCIVLCAGAASTNLFFCKKSVDIFCFLPYEYRCDSPMDETSTIDVKPHMVDCKIESKGEFMMYSTFSAPLEKCERIVEFCKTKGYL